MKLFDTNALVVWSLAIAIVADLVIFLPQQELCSLIPAAEAASGAEQWEQRLCPFIQGRKQVNVVFLGDSITEGWSVEGKPLWDKYFAPLPAVNLGIGGDTTSALMGHLDAKGALLKQLRPATAVLLIGTNDDAAMPASEVTGRITAIVQKLQNIQPRIQIILFGIFPRTGPRLFTMRERNTLIQRIGNGKNVKYVDISRQFVNENDEIPTSLMPDGTHLSEAGYQIWADALRPLLSKRYVSHRTQKRGWPLPCPVLQ